MSHKSLEVRKYANALTVEFFQTPTPFAIEDDETVILYTSGASDDAELAITCSVDGVDHAIEVLDSVIRDQLSVILNEDTIFDEDNIELEDGSGRIYSLVNVTENESARGVVEYICDHQHRDVELLQVYWPDSTGAQPNDPSYMHNLSPQPLLC